MKTLSIDSSNLVMGVAINDDDRVLGEIITNVKKNHSIRLMPAIQQLMDDVGVSSLDLDRIAVAQGPGSYTGVRIGVSIAKSLAWSLNIDLVGVSSLEILAQNGRYFDGYIVPFFDARRGQVYTGMYQFKDGQVIPVLDDRIVLMEQWLEQIKEHREHVLFLSNDMEKHGSAITAALGEQTEYADISINNPRPAELGRLGMLKSPVNDIHTFAPAYIQMAEAEAKWLEAQRISEHE
ncbi:tRNA (adenosine(37)-N6)-threonylcarbamoyltransferase complex dimerization subunit type 1 TsaB [Tuberibacillus sp. Marseille-P3662]|uniref:tRNA (adenosine(37)-N6)-threonylcarbamoyltransferase complex dimerization subunit type 1 TsaB n=1 Tax=Tuberibacillus sp. Marseille-P3662 TaxID=1965358 RepID=UPI000A1C9761|nr:tRNA (adenosine(37)-N6)-threonylcarbamoyltransferase complex dimerization subunit type 1 TsaB [Tuberibacillus sp. Marseille-P3662]